MVFYGEKYGTKSLSKQKRSDVFFSAVFHILYNKNMEKKPEQQSKTEIVGDRNTRKAKQEDLVNTECLIIKICLKFLFKTADVCDHVLISATYQRTEMSHCGVQRTPSYPLLSGCRLLRSIFVVFMSCLVCEESSATHCTSFFLLSCFIFNAAQSSLSHLAHCDVRFFLRHINTLTYLLTYLLIICIFIRIKCITIKKNKKFSTDKLHTQIRTDDSIQ